MDDLITWLRAQIRTDEMLAKTAFGDHNDAGPEWTEIWSGTVDTGDEHIACFDSGLSRHIVNVDPARVLREVEAKRAILGDIQMCQACGIGRRCVPHDSSFGEPTTRPAHPDDDQLIRLLASPFSDRPGYQESWRP